MRLFTPHPKMVCPNDSISVSLVRKLTKCRDPDGPVHFFLDFDQCSCPEAIQFAGEVLKQNSTIAWLEVEFRYVLIPVECMTNLLQFVANNPYLKVLEVRIENTATRTPSSLMGYLDEVMRLFLLAAAQNSHLETVKLRGRACQYATEIFKFIDRTSNIRELELVNFPDSLVAAWPPNTSISTLRLKPAKSERYRNPLNPDGHPGLTGILDLLSESNSRAYHIKHLHIREWSWSLPKYLQSPNSSVVSLHLVDVNFRHDRFTGFSPINVFVFGIQGSRTTTELCMESCILDSKGINKLLKELKENTLGLKTLRLINTELDGKHIQQLLQCDSLERLEFEMNVEIVDKGLYSINEGLSSCALAALKIPVTSIAAVAPSLKSATTTQSLRRLEITNTKLGEADVVCLADMLEDPRCQLNHLSLDILSGIDIKVMMALEGNSKVQSFRLKDMTGNALPDIVDGLTETLENIMTMTSLTIVCLDVPRTMERELAEAFEKNWSLEHVSFERMVFENDDKKIHEWEPVTSIGFRKKLAEIAARNIGQKRSMASSASPNSVMEGPGTRISATFEDLVIG